MSQVTVTLPDGSPQPSLPGPPVRDVAAADLAAPRRRPRWPRRSTTGWSTCPTRSPPTRAVRIVTDKSPEALQLYRHSTAHLLAAAVTALFPGTQCGIGPATDEGFFYDFVVEPAVRARGPRRRSSRR